MEANINVFSLVKYIFSGLFKTEKYVNKIITGLSESLHNKPFVMHFALLRRKMTRQTEQGVSS